MCKRDKLKGDINSSSKSTYSYSNYYNDENGISSVAKALKLLFDFKKKVERDESSAVAMSGLDINVKSDHVLSSDKSDDELYDLHNIVHELCALLKTPRRIAMLRRDALMQRKRRGNYDHDNASADDEQGDLSYVLVNCLLKQSVQDFMKVVRSATAVSTPLSSDVSLTRKNETKLLCKVLQLHTQLTTMDVTLAEEIAKCGGHLYLSKLIYLDSSSIIEAMYDDNCNCNSLPDRTIIERDEDTLTEIQNEACELVYDIRLPHLTFPVKVSAFSHDELVQRLPLEFHVRSPYCDDYHQHHGNDNENGDDNNIRDNVQVSQFMSFLVQQVTDRQSAQEDVGFVMWPSAVVLSSWLIANSEVLYNKQILELGAGCGLTGLVASRIVAEYEQQQHQRQVKKYHLEGGTLKQSQEEKKNDDTIGGNNIIPAPLSVVNSNPLGKKVLMTDFNQKVLCNLDRNIELNELDHVASTSKLDFYFQGGTNYEGGWVSEDKQLQQPVDLIIAADVICKPSDSVSVSKTIFDSLKPGGEAILVSADAKHRFGVDIFEKECTKIGLTVNVVDVTDLCEGKLLPSSEDSDDPCGIRQTSGFIDGMSLTMFRVLKPLQ